MKNKTTLIFGFILLLFLNSCEPETLCTEPKCKYSDVNYNLEASISGKMDSIINIGDTIYIRLKICDTMKTNYGEISFGSISSESFFTIEADCFDTITNNGAINLSPLEIKPIKFHSQNFRVFCWDITTREFECLIIPAKKGKCYLQINGGKVIMNDINNKQWAINPIIYTNQTKRINQYLGWMSESMRPEAEAKLRQINSWYCFEVK